MPILGVVIGRSIATALGADAHWLGVALLIATGAYGLYGTLRGDDDEQEGLARPASRSAGSC
jgi:putative Mn2+ efflux pump MntP